jgi:hypothetical protein
MNNNPLLGASVQDETLPIGNGIATMSVQTPDGETTLIGAATVVEDQYPVPLEAFRRRLAERQPHLKRLLQYSLPLREAYIKGARLPRPKRKIEEAELGSAALMTLVEVANVIEEMAMLTEEISKLEAA